MCLQPNTYAALFFRTSQAPTPVEFSMQETNGSHSNEFRAFNDHQYSRGESFPTSIPPAPIAPLSKSLPELPTPLINAIPPAPIASSSKSRPGLPIPLINAIPPAPIAPLSKSQPELPTSLIDAMNYGQPFLSTFQGTSQYSLGAPSACGVASVNAVREILLLEQSGRHGVDLLLDMDTQQFHEDIITICTSLSDAVHLEVDDIMRLPIFDLCLDLISLDHKLCSEESFLTVMNELGAHSLAIDAAVAAVITRVPEIISVICIPLNSDAYPPNIEYEHVFAVFDSHNRPTSPGGSAITFLPTPEQAATYLADLFSVDSGLLHQSGMQWEAQLLSTFSAHIVAATPGVTQMVYPHPGHVSTEHENKWDGISPVTRRIMYVANIELLQAQTRIRDLEREVVDLWRRITTSNVGLSSISPEDGVLRLNDGGGRSRQQIKRSKKLVDLAPEDGFSVDTIELDPSNKIDGERGAHAIPPATGTSHHTQEKPSIKRFAQYFPDLRDHFAASSKHSITPVYPELPEWTRQGFWSSTGIKGKGKVVSESSVPRPLTGRRASIADNDTSEDTLTSDYLMALDLQLTEGSITPEDAFTSDYLMALELQRTEDSIVAPPNNKNVSPSHPPVSNRAGSSGMPRTQIETDPPAYTHNDTKHNFNPTAKPQDFLINTGGSMLASDHEYALELQRAFEREEREAEEMRARLVVEFPKQEEFECGICLDTYLIDFAAPVDGCKHVLCRDCLRRYVVSKLDEGRYPIVCPMCSSVKIGQDPGFVTAQAAELLGLSQDQYETWTRLELGQYTILIDCPYCRSSSLVDREDYQASSIIQCPACGGAWCKECSQLLDLTSGPHSCDGQAEMDRYILSRSLKRCPGCKTPTEHNGGCNHMACTVPGCNTHFCYLCGELIISSVVGEKTKNAVTEHYSRCKLFEH